MRGVSKNLSSNLTSAENTSPTNGSITAFNSDGFTLGDGAFETNDSRQGYVAWNWKANGSGVSNTVGDIPSTVSANTESGFSIVSYTGTGANATVGHGLNSAPDMIIIKDRTSAYNWLVGHVGIGLGSGRLWMNLTTANTTAYSAALWNSTAPTATTVSIGTDVNCNNSGDSYIALCWHEVEGFSKFGSYTGNGSADGPFVPLPFKPAFVMVKRTDAVDNWYVNDGVRDDYNSSDAFLIPNSSNAESTGTARVDLLSNGFKIVTTGAGYNASGGTYIYTCFSESPFKYSNAR